MSGQIQQTYRAAMESFVDRVRQDSHVLAVFVAGSLSYDEVWEKSDIDMHIVTDDEKRPYAAYHLVEHGICISASVTSRTEFKKTFEQSIQTGFSFPRSAANRLGRRYRNSAVNCSNCSFVNRTFCLASACSEKPGSAFS